ncbi:hypothetical protein ACJ41O_014639 [Fusarium nematophilum]
MINILITLIRKMFFRKRVRAYDPKDFPRYRTLFPQPKTKLEMLLDGLPPVMSFLNCNWQLFLIMFNTALTFLCMVCREPRELPAAIDWIVREYKSADGARVTHGGLLLFWLYRTLISLSYTTWDVLVIAFHRWVPFYRLVWSDRRYWWHVAIRTVSAALPAIADVASFLIVSAFSLVVLYQIGLSLFDLKHAAKEPEPLPQTPTRTPSPKINKPSTAGYVEVSPKAKKYLAVDDATTAEASGAPSKTSINHSLNSSAAEEGLGTILPKDEPQTATYTSQIERDELETKDLKTEWLEGAISSVQREITHMSNDLHRLQLLVNTFNKETNARPPTPKPSTLGGSFKSNRLVIIQNENDREKYRLKSIVADYNPQIELLAAHIQRSHRTFQDALIDIEGRVEYAQNVTAVPMHRLLRECESNMDAVTKATTKTWAAFKSIEARCAQRMEELDEEVARMERINKMHKVKRVGFSSENQIFG